MPENFIVLQNPEDLVDWANKGSAASISLEEAQIMFDYAKSKELDLAVNTSNQSLYLIDQDEIYATNYDEVVDYMCQLNFDTLNTLKESMSTASEEEKILNNMFWKTKNGITLAAIIESKPIVVFEGEMDEKIKESAKEQIEASYVTQNMREERKRQEIEREENKKRSAKL
ncbi:MAG: hypothetical protein E7242_01145 [Lachnospiraceae bacterium]|nr:hypothetical protein [Lachnospiraceae bacterium]